LTEITSGLNAGDEVMLADLSQPLPSTTSGLRGIGGAGGGARPGG
jgi:HlyD family secretion protein